MKTKEKKAPKEKEWVYKAPKTKCKLSATAIERNLVFSKTDVWAAYEIPSISYEFLDGERRETYAHDFSDALENLLTSGDKPVHAHQIVTSRPFDTLAWGNKLYSKVQAWNPEPGFPEHLFKEMQHVDSQQFSVKEVFLLVHLGKRTKDYLSTATGMGLAQQVIRWTENLAMVNDPLVPEREIEYWKQKEKVPAHTITTSRVKGKRATSTQIAWLIKKSMFPGMHVPDPQDSPHASWGYGELQSLVTGVIKNDRRHLEISQFDPMTGEETTGYRATLSFSRFPDVMEYPRVEPWIHSASILPFDVDIHTRFTIEPALRVKKEVSKKIKDAKDQLANASGSGQETPLEMQEQYEVATNLEYELNRQRRPWIYARHRAVIEAPTLDLLRSNAQQLIEHYRSENITVVWPATDQLSLFQETMPGDKVRDNAFYQRHVLDILGAGMPHGSGTVGDSILTGEDGKQRGWIGQYLGYTTSRVKEIVCLSVHSAIARNNSPGLAITGAPGGGKSFSAFTMTYQMALEGVWTIYLDPKADAGPIVELPGLKNPKKFDLREGNDGLLDPFSIGNSVPEKQLLALETVRLLTGSLPHDQESALIESIQKVAHSTQYEPSLDRVVDDLYTPRNKKENVPAYNLGAKLNLVRDLPFANLCFSPQKSVNHLRPDEGLTVVTLLGLSLPSASMSEESYSYENRLAVGVMYLLTSFTRQLMLSLNKRQPKAIVIDEAWAITSTPQGAKIVPEVARMGRSHNTALILVSQNAGDLLSEGITNSISIKIAYRANVRDEVVNVLKLFDLEQGMGIEETIQQLKNGECLIKDADLRVARVQVDAWNEAMKTAFDTNPETRNDKNSGVSQ